MLTLSLDTEVFRVLQENESYYKMYDNNIDHEEIDEDDYWSLLEDSDEDED